MERKIKMIDLKVGDKLVFGSVVEEVSKIELSSTGKMIFFWLTCDNYKRKKGINSEVYVLNN